jgi:RNA-binding protein
MVAAAVGVYSGWSFGGTTLALTSAERRELVARSHTLKPVATLAAGELTDTAVAHVRTALTAHDLLKVRLQADTTAECDALAAQLAQRIPCEVVRRIGRIVILHRAAE